MREATSPIIELIGLRKEFNAVVAVADLNLEVREGEFLCFLGPSGCGKTTTLRMIAGLETPTRGEVRLRGQSITHLPPQKRHVGFMFQNYALFWHMTVYENLAFGLRVRKRMPAEIDRVVRRVAANLELEDVLNVRAARLDLSAMQRVAMARVLAVEPEVLLLDEPLNNFRPGLREVMRGELKRWQKQLGRTMIYVTHDQEEALTLGDRILVMNEGHVEQIASPREIYQRPANLFVAGFIGRPPMNMLQGQLAREGERLSFLRPGMRLDVSAFRRALESAQVGGDLILGVRPSDVLPINGQPPPARHLSQGLPARVDLVLPLGRKKIVDLRLDGESVKMVLPSAVTVSRGDMIQVAFDLDRLHIFDPRSGRAII